MFEKGGADPLQEVLFLVQRPQHKSTSDSVKAPKKIILALFLYNLAILRNPILFGGLN